MFCGIGGLTYGLCKSGVRVKAGVDNDSSCRGAYEHNNPDTDFIDADIYEVTAERINSYFDEADIRVLVGCAPCQPFSSHTKKYNRGKTLKRSENFSLLLEIARLIKECQPDIVSVENVPGLLKEKIYSDFLSILKGLGYVGETKVVFCPEYGVPQTRKRLVFLASKIGEIRLIPPLYEKPWPTVAQYIKHLPPIRNGSQSKKDIYHSSLRLTERNLKRIQQSNPGGDWRDWDKRLISPCQKKAIYFAPYGRMRWDMPAPTITTQFCYYSAGRFGHPTQNRAISLREGALLQTFPKSYRLHDKNTPVAVTKIARHIGNAVPVKLGEAIGESIMRHVNE